MTSYKPTTGRQQGLGRSEPSDGVGASFALLAKFVFALLVGSLLGIALTFFSLEGGVGFGAVKAGAWTGWPQYGLADIDPYSRARLARSHELPLGAAEGISFVAAGDDQGTPFHPSCDYVVTGNVPRARYWTLTLLSPEGFLVPNTPRRYGFTSSEILRAADGTFEIVLSRQARAGNWLPIGSAAPFVLVLRLYDSELDAGAPNLQSNDLPKVLRGGCR